MFEATSEIDMLINSESKAPGGAEVVPMKLVLLHLEPALQDLLRLLATHGHVAGDLLVPTNAERAHGVARCEQERSVQAMSGERASEL